MNQTEIKSHKLKLPSLLIIIGLVVLLLMTAISVAVFRRQSSILEQGTSLPVTYKRHYAFIGDSSSSFANAIYDAAYAQGLESGDYVEFMGKDLSVHYSEDDLMQIAIASGVDGIILSTTDETDLQEYISKADETGIPVVCVGNDCYGSARKSYAGVSYYTLGQEYGKQILPHFVGKNMTILIVTSPEEHSTSQSLVISGMKDFLNDSSYGAYFHLASVVPGDGSMFSTQEAVTDMFEKGDLPDIIVCLDETSTTSACQAIVDSNHVGDVVVIGYYVNDTILNALSKQIIPSTLTVSTKSIGSSAISCLDEYIESGFVTEYQPVDVEVITADNVNEYLNQQEDKP